VFFAIFAMFPGRNPGTCTEAYRYLSLKIANLRTIDEPINARWLYIHFRYIAKRGLWFILWWAFGDASNL